MYLDDYRWRARIMKWKPINMKQINLSGQFTFAVFHLNELPNQPRYIGGSRLEMLLKEKNQYLIDVYLISWVISALHFRFQVFSSIHQQQCIQTFYVLICNKMDFFCSSKNLIFLKNCGNFEIYDVVWKIFTDKNLCFDKDTLIKGRLNAHWNALVISL